MIGQQLFANGTGIAYFDDGSTSEFKHSLRPSLGYYYDNNTAYYVGEVPGISSNANNVLCDNNSDLDAGSRGNIVNFTIINGASVIENKSKAIDPSPITRIKVNDTETWTNEDYSGHSLASPPASEQSLTVPRGSIFSKSLPAEAGKLSCTFTQPRGFHYDVDLGDDRIVGTVIVEES